MMGGCLEVELLGEIVNGERCEKQAPGCEQHLQVDRLCTVNDTFRMQIILQLCSYSYSYTYRKKLVFLRGPVCIPPELRLPDDIIPRPLIPAVATH
jgi:hypothetical protein